MAKEIAEADGMVESLAPYEKPNTYLISRKRSSERIPEVCDEKCREPGQLNTEYRVTSGFNRSPLKLT
jgi:hypothetical protein